MGSPTGNPADMASMSIYPRRVVAVAAAADFTLAPTDCGKVFECAGSVNITVPVGLQPDYHVSFLPLAGTVSLISSGGTLMNGATTTITRAQATAGNAIFTLQKRVTAADSFSVNGA